ncbi:MAG: hypothetical protein ACM3U1_01980 [Chloroflexota bacterium]
MKRLFLLLTFIGAIVITRAQDVVVSEYYNISGVPQGEWTELLVIKDNLDMTGYVIRDNSDGNGWQGGVKFRDNPLWKNLRAGTIIVVNHRNYQWNEDDFNKADGHIAVSAENATYFEKVLYNATDWASFALSMNQTNDMLEILDASGRHVHLLGHMATAQPDYLAVTGPKAAYQGDVNNGATVRVVPGLDISAYSSGLGTQQVTTGNTTPADARGLPNQPFNNPPNLDKNQLFWRKLRQPAWTANTVNYDFAGGKLNLSWTPASASDADPVQGYIILRMKAGDAGSAVPPADGARYAKGDNIGPAAVADIVPSLTTSTWTETSSLDCGSAFLYRIYAYRFDADDLNKDIIRPENARGRQFNEYEFGQTQPISIPKPEKPNLSTLEGKTAYCDGETANLRAQYADVGGLTYQWLRNDAPIAGGAGHDLAVSQAGAYKIKIVTAEGCSETSSPLDIAFAPYPNASISLRKSSGEVVPVRLDTTIYVCNNENNSFVMSAGESRQWLIDGAPQGAAANKTEITITQEGVYRGVAVNSGACADTSFAVTVKYKQVSFSVSPTPLVFDYDTKPQAVLTIKNTGDEPIVFLPSDFKISSNFVIVSPPPFIVPAKGSLDVLIRYKRADIGDFTENFSLVGECGKSRTLVFKSGRKRPDKTILIAEPDSIDFGKRLECDKLDTTITVFAYGLNAVYSTDVSFTEAGFAVQGAGGTFQLDSMQKVELKITYFGGAEGVHTAELMIPYNDSLGVGYDDTLRIPVRIDFVVPRLSIPSATLNFPEIGDCEEYSMLKVTFTNPGREDVTIKEQPADERLVFATPLPVSLKGGESKEIELRFYYKFDPVPFNTDIKYEPCAKSIPVTVNGSRQGLSVSFSGDSIYVGGLATCSDLKSISTTLDITAFGGEIEIGDISVTAGFTTDIIPGTKINGKQTFRLTFVPSAKGFFSGELRVKYEPCDREKVIILTGYLGDLSLSGYPAEYDFGKLAPGAATPITAYCRNTSQFPIHIASIEGATPPFSVTPLYGVSLPVTLQPDSSIYFEVRYNQTEVSKTDTAKIKVVIDSPCDFKYTYVFRGATTNPNAIVRAALITAPRYSVEIGDTVMIPFELRSLGVETFAEAGIDTIEFYLSYDWKVIELRWFAGFDGSSVKSFLSPNRDKLVLKPRDASSLQGGVWGSLEARGLLGKDYSTQIIIDSVRVVSEIPVEFDSLSSPIVDVIGDCGDGSRAAGSLGSLKLTAEKSAATGQVLIRFNALAESSASLKIYDVRGDLIYTAFDGTLTKGEHTYAPPAGKLARGVYLAVYSHLGAVKTASFVVE